MVLVGFGACSLFVFGADADRGRELALLARAAGRRFVGRERHSDAMERPTGREHLVEGADPRPGTCVGDRVGRPGGLSCPASRIVCSAFCFVLIATADARFGSEWCWNLRWKRNIGSTAMRRARTATDGKLVYVAFLDQESMFVAAYDFAGKQRWAVRPGPFFSKHGFCSSPVLFEDLVIVNGDHDGDSYLVALDRHTGKTVWKTPRENQTRSYCTPIIRTIDGRTQMVLSGNKCVASYDPYNGKRHWIIDGPTEQYVASLVYNGRLLFMTAGFPRFSHSGDSAGRKRQRDQHACGVAHDGGLFVRSVADRVGRRRVFSDRVGQGDRQLL